jgi:YbgC/YbaW family acyl-CoA thioester hydrolase
MKHKNRVERKIMWGDLDALGIVFYPRYYEWIDGCSHLFFESINLNLNSLSENRHMNFGLIETGCRYFKPGRYHQTIQIITQLNELDQKTILLKHHILFTDDGSLMVEAHERRICMDISDPGKITALNIPKDIYDILKNAMEG